MDTLFKRLFPRVIKVLHRHNKVMTAETFLCPRETKHLFYCHCKKAWPQLIYNAASMQNTFIDFFFIQEEVGQN